MTSVNDIWGLPTTQSPAATLSAHPRKEAGHPHFRPGLVSTPQSTLPFSVKECFVENKPKLNIVSQSWVINSSKTSLTQTIHEEKRSTVMHRDQRVMRLQRFSPNSGSSIVWLPAELCPSRPCPWVSVETRLKTREHTRKACSYRPGTTAPSHGRQRYRRPRPTAMPRSSPLLSDGGAGRAAGSAATRWPPRPSLRTAACVCGGGAEMAARERRALGLPYSAPQPRFPDLVCPFLSVWCDKKIRKGVNWFGQKASGESVALLILWHSFLSILLHAGSTISQQIFISRGHTVEPVFWNRNKLLSAEVDCLHVAV